ncbi:MAG: hypothetical protein V1789_02935 [PVC group bacterium]
MRSGLLNSAFLVAALSAGVAIPACGEEVFTSSPAPSPPPLPVVSGPPSRSPAPRATATLALPAQEVSGGFIRYIPNRDGDMEWKLAGTSVHFLSPVCMEIADLTADALAPKISDLTINAGKMLFYTDTRIARGDEERITVRRENMVLTGRGYLWTPDNEEIRVFEDVQLLIKEKDNRGLFPL